MQGGMQPGRIHLHRVNPTGDRPRLGYSSVDQVADFIEIRWLGAFSESYSFADGARHKRNGGQMLAKTVVQILPKPALFAVTDAENFSLESFAQCDLVLQFFIRRHELGRALAHTRLQQTLRLLQGR